ncbi:TIGR-Tas system RNA-guided endonuclease [Mycolicibacterium palauense]|uniref:transposase n=1 Tax=Mycolicibacterium palauense TaxID=2034511 RepID=UPI000BFEC237|nr:transposase [Mycolicibacterium palauense]
MSALLADPTLALAAEVVDDLERVRIANENRLRSLTDPEIYGLTIQHPDVLALTGLVEQLKDSEKQATKHLEKVMARHPLGTWVKGATGVGYKQAARLLAALGDPYWNDLYDRPRTFDELCAFSGLSIKSGKAVHRSRGVQSNWNPDARMRLWLVAQSCIKTKGEYRQVYDAGRERYADAVHVVECQRCGPKGKPAQPGSPLSAGHQHARATRLIVKAVLKDLWQASRACHATAQPQKEGK